MALRPSYCEHSRAISGRHLWHNTRDTDLVAGARYCFNCGVTQEPPFPPDPAARASLPWAGLCFLAAIFLIGVLVGAAVW